MANRTLSIWQVASLLVSTSCGIGFLLGTGELALQQGMGACLYAVSTSLGLLALALVAPRLWKTGESIWAHFGTLYGSAVRRLVAALSIIWMAGVLSAQIRGASAILTLARVPHATSIVAVDCLVIGLSFIRLSWLSGLFAVCMLGCNAILTYALIKAHGFSLWIYAPGSFIKSVRFQPGSHVGLTLLSVVALVLCGADYQQFPIAARTSTSARIGCLVAAVVVFGVGFLPASTVIATLNIWHVNNLPDPVQVIPRLLTLALGDSNPITSAPVILVLVTTALGAACSILRAMSDAAATVAFSSRGASTLHRMICVCVATLVATHGQSMIDMMVTLNIVYLAAVGPLLLLTLLGLQISENGARRSMLTGFVIAAICFLLEWTHTLHMPESIPLVLAWPCALLAVLGSRSSLNASSRPDVAAASLNQISLGESLSGPHSSNSDATRLAG
ncbi:MULTISPECIES: hypothetical protein [Burkholderiaceae]|uniref:hypothetical protein n=1 Tax=Burkholderiaceae TaxID=119060 RepID=UPI0015943E72|nr:MULTISPECIES: hypothetical protein [Burkholderiaceae]